MTRFGGYTLFLILLFVIMQNNATAIITTDYEKGIKALQSQNIDFAEQYFKNSIIRNKDAPSFFELAKIYASKGTPLFRFQARSLIKKAIYLAPENLDYRYFYCDLLERFATITAINQYKTILEKDSTQAKAWYKLARLSDKEFNEYHQSVKTTDIAPIFFEHYAQEDLRQAEQYFLKAIENDPTYYDALLHLGFLYEDAGLYEKSLKRAEEITERFPNDKEANLFEGLLAYKNSKVEQASIAFKKALILMEEEEKQDYIFHSVNFLLEPILEDKDYNTDQLKLFKQKYWAMSDPALLTDYNERLIEHYARVAYANLRFSVPTMDIKGWQTDRGKIFIRYGQPLNRMRLRPQMESSGIVKAKTDVWTYDGVSFGFTDEYSSGHFQFSVPASPGSRVQSQFAVESALTADGMENTEPERYAPVFEGPAFDIALNIKQFRNEKSHNKTDVYFNYAMPIIDSLENLNYSYNHKNGIFFFDKNFERKFSSKTLIDQFKKNQILKTSDTSDVIINNALMTYAADSGSMAFEVMRDFDKGFSSNHGSFKIKKYQNNKLTMSDIVLAKELSFEGDEKFLIHRNETAFTPNPLATFKTTDNVFLYFEIYGLGLNADRFTQFEQRISISKIENVENTALTFFSNLFGFEKEQKQITIENSYQTEQKDTPIYLQLDLGKYEADDYKINITIIDNISGQNVSEQTFLYLK